MNAEISCITLPVDDLKAALEFYRDGLGFPVGDVGELSPEEDHIPLQFESGLYLVLLLRREFETFTELANQPNAPAGSSECALSYFAASKSEVDTLLMRSDAHGGTVVCKAQEQSWGYSGNVRDPDGHLWEIMFNPHLNEERG